LTVLYREFIKTTSYEMATGTTENIPGLPKHPLLDQTHFGIVAYLVKERDCENEYYPDSTLVKRYRCPRCKELVKTWMIQVHHVIPRSQGGSHNPLNLRALCQKCHAKVHRQMGGFNPSENKKQLQKDIRSGKQKKIEG
jgi:5-methylcytosine-specific restriction endonuclease McrA